MGWINDIYTVYKSWYASRAQKKSQKAVLKAAERDIYVSLLSSGVLTHIVDDIQDIRAMYLDHLEKDHHLPKPKALKPIEDEDDTDYPPPPPPLPPNIPIESLSAEAQVLALHRSKGQR